MILEWSRWRRKGRAARGPCIIQSPRFTSLFWISGSLWELRESVGIYRFSPDVPAPNSSPLYPLSYSLTMHCTVYSKLYSRTPDLWHLFSKRRDALHMHHQGAPLVRTLAQAKRELTCSELVSRVGELSSLPCCRFFTLLCFQQCFFTKSEFRVLSDSLPFSIELMRGFLVPGTPVHQLFPPRVRHDPLTV